MILSGKALHMCLFVISVQRPGGKHTTVKLCGDPLLFMVGVEVDTGGAAVKPYVRVTLRIWPVSINLFHDL